MKSDRQINLGTIDNPRVVSTSKQAMELVLEIADFFTQYVSKKKKNESFEFKLKKTADIAKRKF